MGATIFAGATCFGASPALATCIRTGASVTCDATAPNPWRFGIRASDIYILPGAIVRNDQVGVGVAYQTVEVQGSLVASAGSQIFDNTGFTGPAVRTWSGTTVSASGTITSTQPNMPAVILGGGSSLTLNQGGIIDILGNGSVAPAYQADKAIGIGAAGDASTVLINGLVRASGMNTIAIKPTVNDIFGVGLFKTNVTVGAAGVVSSLGHNGSGVVLGGGSNLTVAGLVNKLGTGDGAAIGYVPGGAGPLIIAIALGGSVTAAQGLAIGGEGADVDLLIAGTVSVPVSTQTAVQLGSGADRVTQTSTAQITGGISGGAGVDTVRLQGTSATAASSQAIARYDQFETLNVDTGYWTASAQVGSFQIANIATGASLEVRDVSGSSPLAVPTIANAGQLIFNFTDPAAATAFAATDVSGSGTIDISRTPAGASIRSLSGAGAVTLGSKTLTLVNAAGPFSGVMSGTGGLTLAGGTLSLTGVNTYSGATTVSAGTLTLSGSNPTVAPSAVTVANGATLALGSTQTIGSLSGAGAVTLGANTLSTNGDNSTTTFSGAISGLGGLTKLGSGTLFLTGANTYSGPTTVTAGVLSIDGSLPNSVVSLLNGAQLKGSGQLGGVAVAAGGVMAPGNSIGTLNVGGPISFAAGSTYQVEVDAAGSSDKIIATGPATLAGQVRVIPSTTGVYAPETDYVILTAAGGISGSFGSVTSDLAYLTPNLSYTTSAVTLRLRNNGVSIQSYATTPNQMATATAVDSVQTGVLFSAILGQSVTTAPLAFDALSGEVYASSPTVVLAQGRYLRDGVLGRLRQASSNVAGSGADLQTGQIPGAGVTLWGKVFGARGEVDSQATGTIAGVKSDNAGLILGVDAAFGALTTGAAIAQDQGTIESAARASRNEVESTRVAGYAGYAINGLRLRGGVSLVRSDLDSSRQVVFPGISDDNRASYKAKGLDVFGEVAYQLALGQVAVEPFANAAFARLKTDALAEGASASALSVGENETKAFVSEVGVRVSGVWTHSASAAFTPYGSIARRHVEGSGDPATAMTFRSSGATFLIAGLESDRDTAAIELGLKATLGHKGSLGLGYSGEFGDGWRDNQVKLAASWQF